MYASCIHVTNRAINHQRKSVWHGLSNTGINMLSIFSFYLLVYHFPSVFFLCGNKVRCGGHARSGKKIQFPLLNCVLWQHVTRSLHSLPLLFCFHVFVINEQYQFSPYVSLRLSQWMCATWHLCDQKPQPSLLKAHLCLGVIVFKKR